MGIDVGILHAIESAVRAHTRNPSAPLALPPADDVAGLIEGGPRGALPAPNDEGQAEGAGEPEHCVLATSDRACGAVVRGSDGEWYLFLGRWLQDPAKKSRKKEEREAGGERGRVRGGGGERGSVRGRVGGKVAGRKKKVRDEDEEEEEEGVEGREERKVRRERYCPCFVLTLLALSQPWSAGPLPVVSVRRLAHFTAWPPLHSL